MALVCPHLWELVSYGHLFFPRLTFPVSSIRTFHRESVTLIGITNAIIATYTSYIFSAGSSNSFEFKSSL